MVHPGRRRRSRWPAVATDVWSTFRRDCAIEPDAYGSGVNPVHEWSIPEREYARHEARRGRRHAYEALDPARTALVVVDLVESFVRENPYAAATVPVVNRLTAAVRAAGGHVVWVVPADVEPTPVRIEFFGPEVAALYSRAHDEPWWELAVDPGDPVVQKKSWGAFFPGSSDLHEVLTARGVDTLVVAGTVTHVCVESTVREANVLGYRVVVVADACATVSDEMHNASLTTIYRTFGDVRSSDEVAGLLARQEATP